MTAHRVPTPEPEHVVNMLRQIEQSAHDTGWDHPPILLAIFIEPTPRTVERWRLVARTQWVPPTVWRHHPDGPLGVITDVTDLYSDRPAGYPLDVSGGHNPHARLVSWAFVYLLRSPLGLDLRVVDAVDLTLTFRRLTRLRGDSKPAIEPDTSLYEKVLPATRDPLTGLLRRTR